MVVLDVTIVNIALPSAQKALGFSNEDRQWIVPAYALAFGGLLLLGGVLTEHLNWRWTLYVNLVFAVIAFVGGWALLTPGARGDRPKLLGTVLVSAGLFAVVYGFANAETHS